MDSSDFKIAIIGLGYVGLPLAVEFAEHFSVVGYDLSDRRVSALKNNTDGTHEADMNRLQRELREGRLTLTTRWQDMAQANRFVVTVPTPVDKNNNPDLAPLLGASEAVGRVLKKGDIVIYESTTYPGCTEEDCVPVLERVSGLKFNRDFYCGYSPERINPSDEVHTLTSITKVTSGSTPWAAKEVDSLYASIIKAGTHLAPSIKVAEASKAIENAPRDINISFVNELALIFDKMGIDTHDVLQAAATKWNFVNFKPGLVGGHCIGVDPYYLAAKSSELGYEPQLILTGRRVNNYMAFFVAGKVKELIDKRHGTVAGKRVLILGVTFKENSSDTRNTKVVDLYADLCRSGLCVEVYDPHADVELVRKEYGIELLPEVEGRKYDAVVLAVAHSEFRNFDFAGQKAEGAIIYDVKGVICRDLIDGRL